MRRILLVISIFTLFIGWNKSCGQPSETQEVKKYFSKIEIDEGDSVFVETDSLLVDTLIMRDKASLNFLYGQSCLAVSHAFIGSHCKISGNGVRGENGKSVLIPAQPGTRGRDLTISIRFETLGSLVISSRGGDGGDGANGQPGYVPGVVAVGQRTEAGEDGGNGGDGGDGGNINLFYISKHFLIPFHEDREHSIRFDTSGGRGGMGGKGGQGGPILLNNRTLFYGRKAADGRKGAHGTGGQLRFLRTQSGDY